MRKHISAAIHCQLGNNLFQIAQGYAQARKHDREFVLFTQNKWVMDGNPHLPVFRNNILRNFNIVDGMPPESYQTVLVKQEWYEEADPLDGDTIFYGQPQSEKYFKNYREEFKALISPTIPIVEKLHKQYPMLMDSVVTSIQVRRGSDQTTLSARHPVVSAAYLNEAVRQVPSDHYFIFSDNVEWCKLNLAIENSTIIDNNRWEDFWLMGMCHNSIISNSTFGWWAAYTTPHKNKKVLIPECWFGPEIFQSIPDMTTKDIPAEGWTVVPSKFENGCIVPT